MVALRAKHCNKLRNGRSRSFRSSDANQSVYATPYW